MDELHTSYQGHVVAKPVRKPCLTVGINTDELCYEVTGQDHHDGNIYCENCLEWWNTWYPQGWVSYPGDTCKHGTYVGGCGYDMLCAPCEGE